MPVPAARPCASVVLMLTSAGSTLAAIAFDVERSACRPGSVPFRCRRGCCRRRDGSAAERAVAVERSAVLLPRTLKRARVRSCCAPRSRRRRRRRPTRARARARRATARPRRACVGRGAAGAVAGAAGPAAAHAGGGGPQALRPGVRAGRRRTAGRVGAGARTVRRRTGRRRRDRGVRTGSAGGCGRSGSVAVDRVRLASAATRRDRVGRASATARGRRHGRRTPWVGASVAAASVYCGHGAAGGASVGSLGRLAVLGVPGLVRFAHRCMPRVRGCRARGWRCCRRFWSARIGSGL